MQLFSQGKVQVHSCTCNTYLHYAQCKHVLALHRKSKLVQGWPRLRDPTSTQGQKAGVGGPPKSRAGEAFGAKRRARGT